MYKNKILKQEAPTNLQQIVMSHTMFAPASTRVVHTCKLAQLTFAGFLISSGFHTCMGPHANRCMLSKLATGQPLLGGQNLKMFWLRVALLLLVCCTTRSCWAEKNASLTSITVLPCSGSHTQDVSLYSSDIYTVIANLSLCPDLETNGTVVRTLPYG